MPKAPEYRNLLEVLEYAALYEPKALMAEIAPYQKTINDRLPYRLEKQPKKVLMAHPLQFVINRGLFHLVQFLYEHNASHQIHGYQAFKNMAARNAPLDVLDYCLQHNKFNDDEKYPALLAVYYQKDQALEKFELIHQHCFGLSFEAIVMNRKPEFMSQDTYLANIEYHSKEIVRSQLLKDELSKVYLAIIKNDPYYKSYLKIRLILGKDNPITNFLKMNPADFASLQAILKEHNPLAQYIDKIGAKLNREDEEPNQAMAGIYFAHYCFIRKDDYELLKKHLGDPKDHLNQQAKDNFGHLLKNYLNNDEMTTLKKNCYRAIKRYPLITQCFSQELAGRLEKSPMNDIIHTGTTSRKKKRTGTSIKAMNVCGLFAKKANNMPPRQESSYSDALSAYGPDYTAPQP